MHVFQRVIATFQIVGSSAAAVFFMSALPNTELHSGTVLVLLIMLGLFAFAFLSGIWLWNGESRGIRYSILVQALQIPVIDTAFLTYRMAFGFGVALTFPDPVLVGFDFGSSAVLTILSGSETTRFGINLFAPIALAYLARLKATTSVLDDAAP